MDYLAIFFCFSFAFLSLCDVFSSPRFILFSFRIISFCFSFLFCFFFLYSIYFLFCCAAQMYRSVNVIASIFSSLIFVEENHFEIDFIFYFSFLLWRLNNAVARVRLSSRIPNNNLKDKIASSIGFLMFLLNISLGYPAISFLTLKGLLCIRLCKDSSVHSAAALVL